MRLSHASPLFLVFAVGSIVLACGDDDPAGPTPDGGVIPDGGNADTDGGSEAGPSACAKVGGVYGITGTCTSPLVVPPSILCVRQTECSLRGTNDFPGQVLTGTATNTNVTATAEQPAPQTCTGDIANGKLGALSCTGAGITCDMTAAPATIANAVDYCCDVVAQDCPESSRCMPMGIGTSRPLVNACVPDRGTVDLNGACTRASTANEDIGNDDCKKGLFCANGGQPTSTSRICRKLCKNNADCAAPDEACFDLTGVDAGFCMPRCSIFDGSGATACGAGNTCRPDRSLVNDRLVLDLRCDFTGAGAAGATCEFHSDCAAGLACNDGKACAALCDAAHPCAAGTCKARTGTPAPGYDATTGICN